MLRNGEEWEKSRKTVQEKLCPNAVANYTPVLLDIADDVLSSRRITKYKKEDNVTESM
jgi:cytochrome P450